VRQLRLTYNYWRKGGYTRGSEDYRWAVIKKYFNEPIWVIFNAIIISLFQSVLLALVTTPTYILLLASYVKPELGSEDVLWPQILGGLLMVEFYADNQQWGTPLHPFPSLTYRTDSSQPTKKRSASTAPPPKSPPTTPPPTSTAASAPPASGATAATPTSPPSRPSGSSCTSGGASRPGR